ncbi:hypothetical protein G7B40_040220 [Aetokthonos hydrillicola Thurmond2011]|jgi:hypothetical protein|uniref:Uncharacterized protein n=1 Tax=Aetokthonos hydrillicola Thurmond2011 TaxID=2712845 RepID=A0AAP5IFE2_9CYAN|nr:hypothetical protein [Aetokthonos hydrillicola]MBO3459955.1 hypothetical protein [Aetokthonos hydrillicola CCALA 1050]MBW4584074.1 hypothetical protein [Aetokthonos hydrillicola CCALA 1050]MDR9900716.1 hypothetical protein [Aetokthonos hydrillicola Thurmond2011]
MPLTDHQINLLFEVYEITQRDTTVVVGGEGSSRLQPDLFNSNTPVRQALQNAIALINDSPSQTERVGTILEEFECISLDPSNIDKDGYQLRPQKNLAAIRARLYPYTGILFKSGGNRGNKICLG